MRLLTFHALKTRLQIHEQRRKDLDDRLKLRRMGKIFESANERRRRLSLEHLRNQDWK